MYYIVITFLLESETLLLPSLEKGQEIFAYLRKNYNNLIFEEHSHLMNFEKLDVHLYDPTNNLIDTIYFTSVFGQTDYEGLQSIIHKQLNTTNLS